jgi:ribosomal protein S18 acetylase RimI-like enzyme
MKLSIAELRRLERLHVRAWPAFETADVEGWLWRCSGGGSQRANSVSTVDFRGGDVRRALEEVEERYRAKGAPARLHTYSVTQPRDLAEILDRRGYQQGEATLTMVKLVGKTPSVAAETSMTATADWLDVYLGAITQDRRAVNRRILEAVPEPRAFFAFRDGGRVISTALCVLEPATAASGGGFAVIECVATRQEARRNGGAKAVLAALEAHACERGIRLLGLQVSKTNPPAIDLYAALGFAVVDENRFWVQAK